jgi:hypothetical protein
MKLEVGNYVRTRDGFLWKPKKIEIEEDNSVWFDDYYDFDVSDVKASNNIIDLIEVGDYVNGCYVEEVTKFHLGNGEYIKCVETSEKQSYGWDKAIPETQIHSIVTKEQFESMQYKVD